MGNPTWYSVHGIFRSDREVEGKSVRTFEERVVLFRALSHEEALEKGRTEACEYCKRWPQSKKLARLVSFSLSEEEISEGEEVWSCLRELDVSDDEFLDQIYRGEVLGLRHSE